MFKRFTSEIAKATKNANIKHTTLEATKKAIATETADKILSGTKAIAKELKNKDNLKSKANPTSEKRVRKSFNEKHSDEKTIEFLTQEDDSYYTKSNVDFLKDSIFQEISNLRAILENSEVLFKKKYLSKEVAMFYSSEVEHNGENRGSVYNKKCEIYSDKFKEDPEIFVSNNMTAENLASFIKVEPLPFEPKVVLHSSFKVANCDTYKQLNELVVAKQISAETGNEIFLSGDCGSDDPEFLAWKGDLKIKDLHVDLRGQTNVDYYQKVINDEGETQVVAIIRGELKHRAVAKLMSNSQLGPNDKPMDLYISAGSVDESSQRILSEKIVSNTLKHKLSEFSKALKEQDTQTIKRLDSEIKNLQKSQSSVDQQNFKAIGNMFKVVFNRGNVSSELTEEIDPEITNDVD